MKRFLRSAPEMQRIVSALALLAGTFILASVTRPAAAQLAPGTFGMPSGDGAVFSLDSPIGPIEYRSARGVRFGDTGLNVGGFSTAEFAREAGEPVEVALDSFNFLVLFEPIQSFRIFTELEAGGLIEYEEGEGTNSDPSLHVERLYGELSLEDAFNLRFGKFQTPIGRWNLVPAEPFVWTAVDPVVLDTAFDEHMTGVALRGTVFPLEGALEYWLYGQIMDPLSPSTTPPPTDRNVGARLQFTRSLEGWSVGSSFLASERGGEWSFLGGLDAEMHRGPFELLSEWTYQNGAIGDRDIFDLWVQGRYEIVWDVSLVARFERFDRLGSKDRDVVIGDVGMAWQPAPWLITKAGYRLSDRQTSDVRRGLFMSLSVIF
ncbi:MAG: hypothetical protein R3F21_07585 [Myxococcota bacterium]